MEENKASKQAVQTAPSTSSLNDVTLNFQIPPVSEFLKAGVQFGHQTKRWNPKMSRYIYVSKAGLHIINVDQTVEELERALKFLVSASSRGPVLFVGTKRQARAIIKELAIDSGSFFITHRWVGGLLTNFEYTRKSLKKLASLEEAFEFGIGGRTKFEISRMKKEWERLNRLYEGIKPMEVRPTAVVVLDAKYEKNAIKESKHVGVPVISIVDTNSDPDIVNYAIPGNDDALSSIKLIFGLFAQAIKQGNKNAGVKHQFKDYSKVEVEIKKTDEAQEEVSVVEEVVKEKEPVVMVSTPKKVKSGEGILERVQKAKEEAKQTKPKTAKMKKAKVEVSSKVLAALKEANISLKKAKDMSDKELSTIKGIGPKSVEEIKNS